MSANSLKVYNYAVWAPDVPNSESLRNEHRSAHLQYVKPFLENGTIRVGGKVVDEEDKELHISESRARGSLIIYKAENLEAAWKLVKDDPLYKNGVFDTQKVSVLPLHAATKFYGED